MKYNVVFTIRGPAGTVEAPNAANPVEASSVVDVLRMLVESPPKVPEALGVHLAGVMVTEE